MQLSSRRILISIFPVILTITIVAGIYSYNNEKYFTNTSYLLKHSYVLLNNSDDVYICVKDIEANSNKYLFTQDSLSLLDYNSSVAATRKAMDILEHSVHNDTCLHPGIDTLTSVIEEHIRFVNRYIELVTVKLFNKQEQLDYTNRNKQFTVTINNVIDRIQARENSLLKKSETENQKSITNFHWIFYSLLSIMFSLVICIILMLNYIAHKQAKAEARLKENQDRLFKISNLSPIPTYITEIGTERIVYANTACENLFLRKREEIIGRNISEIATAFVAPHKEMLKMLEAAKNDGAHNGIDVKINTEKEGEVDMLFSADTVEIDKKDCYLETLVDISDMKREENAIRIALTREKELNEMKSKFVSFASHEFRTPLATILSSSYLITQYQEGTLQSMSIKHLKRIQANVKNLIELLNDFLSLGKLEDGKTLNNPSKINLQEFSDEILENMRLVSKEGQKIVREINGEDGDDVYIDEKLLRNVLNNLLSNAIKYSPAGSVINFTINYNKNDISFVIKDNGIGIPEEDQKHLFESFFRSNNATQIPGTGLGLNIVKRYLDIMNGTIEFTSKLNEGSTFTIHIPKI